MKLKLNYFIDALMLFAFAACGITGIVKLPHLNIALGMETYGVLSFIHDWTGVAGFALVVVHLALHANWITQMTKKIFGSGKKREGQNTAKKTGVAKSAVAILAVILALQAGPQLWAHGPSRATVPQGITYPAGTLKDGTYTGSATGYMPSLQVSVTIKSGSIQSVSVVQHSEGARWYNAVISVLPSRIIKAQSTDVDGVTGATSTTHGILSAVENALAKAVK